MQIHFTDQKQHLRQHLQRLSKKQVMPYDRSELRETVSTIDLEPPLPLEELDLRPLFDYAIFPSHIMTHLTEWSVAGRAMEVGDTIVQQVYLPPTPSFSQKLIFGVRVNEIFDGPERKGFSYETLEGHVEKGISTFTVERSGNKLIFKIHTFSAPGNFLSRLVGPIFSAPYQRFCTKAALGHVRGWIR